MHERENIDKYIKDKEYIANTYVMRCFFISMIVYLIAFLLNVFDIFIIDKSIMLMGFVPSIFIYLAMLFVTKKVSLSSDKIKYFILFSIVSVFTLIGVTITYHVVVIAVLPILYAILYSSKKVMWYVYSLTVVSTIIIVYAGYYYGLCDANMALLTSMKLDSYLVNGYFPTTAVNDNTFVTLMLYFVIPRCLIYIAFMAVCSNIFRIITAGLEKAEYVVKMEVFQKELKSKVDEQTVELREQQRKLNEAYWQTVTALSEAVDAKDRYTSGHSKRVAEYSKNIAKRMGKSVTEQEMIYRAGLLHDVGKIRIPVDIINKPGKLTDEEYDLIKIHPVTGYHILKDISDHYDMAVAAKYHHERYDGKGYPNGLSGEDIPEMARILAV
ncbi:MAG: HD domain-containing phosphohydrolase, partial [Agathobacter sp.]|nr:HD domain-containing phosphohydrolase [Agathobacter sp.]